jgi:hypothetical protein
VIAELKCILLLRIAEFEAVEALKAADKQDADQPPAGTVGAEGAPRGLRRRFRSIYDARRLRNRRKLIGHAAICRCLYPFCSI